MRKSLTLEEEKEICKLYQNGLSRTKLCEQFHRTDKTIKNILNKYNVHIRTIQESNISKYKINDSFFELNKQTHNTAYILGMLASDGCVARNENCIYIELQREDREILEKINFVLENERPVKDYKTTSGYLNSKLYFFSKKMKEDLKQYSIIPNKTSFNNDFIKNIKSDYYIDYIRGHFDGDGSIKWTNGSITWQIDSTSSKTLYHIQNILNTYKIETKVVLKNDKSIVNLPVYRIYCYGYEKCLKLYKLFYEYPPSVTLRMQRKQQHFAELLLKYKTHETSDL